MLRKPRCVSAFAGLEERFCVKSTLLAFDVNARKSEPGFQRPEEIPVIAEIGINHNGDLDIAFRLIKLAHEAGCAAVKFQKRTIDTVYPREVLNSPRDSPWGSTQRDQKQALEFGESDYREIAGYCKELGIEWTASAWDGDSLEFVESFSPPFHKVASAMLTNIPFLKKVSELGRPTMLSTGMSTWKEVDSAVGIFRSSGTKVLLMHTVSTYPTPETDLNLSVIPSMVARYGLPVGYSGHEASVTPSLVAASLGASAIERHITLDRTMYGSDQSASLAENGLKQLVSGVNRIPSMMGDGIKEWAPGEKEVAEKLRYWEV